MAAIKGQPVLQDATQPTSTFVPLDDKLDVSHYEGDRKKPGDTSDAPPESPFKNMPRSKAIKVFWKVAVFSVLVAWTAIMDGFLITIPGSIVANKYFIEQFCTVHQAGQCKLDPKYVGGFTGVQSVGQIIGMLGGPLISDRFGRKVNLAILTVILSLGIVLEMVAKTDPVWLAARLFAGWGTGMSQTVIPVYISEIAPHMLRGALVATYNFWFGVGQFVGAIALQIQVSLVGYKQTIYSQWVFVGVMVIVWFIIPESPWYYLNKNDPVMTKKMMLRLNGNVEGYDVELEYRVLNYEREQQAQTENLAASATYAEIFRGTNLRRTWISWLPLQFQGLGGLSFVLSYTTYFFQLAGVAQPFLGNVIVKTIQLSAQIISFYNIEKFGRRPLLIIGGLGMILGLVAIAVIGSIPHYTPPGGLVVAFFCIWTFSYSSSCAPIGYVYLAEIATPRLRAKTAGFAAACTAVVGIVTNFCSPLLIASISYKTGFVFLGTAVIGWLLMFFTVPEVRGRTYEDLDELFDAHTATRKFAKAKTTRQLEDEAAGESG